MNPRYVRNENGQSVYRAECGHEVLGNRSKRCRACYGKSGVSYPKTVRDGKLVSKHTLIAERVLGRKLKPNEMVHHINLDKRDFRNCNLLICTREYHQMLHHAMEKAYGQLCCPSLPS